MEKKVAIAVCLVGIVIGSVKLMKVGASNTQETVELYNSLDSVLRNDNALGAADVINNFQHWQDVVGDEDFIKDIFAPLFVKYTENEEWKLAVEALVIHLSDYPEFLKKIVEEAKAQEKRFDIADFKKEMGENLFAAPEQPKAGNADDVNNLGNALHSMR